MPRDVAKNIKVRLLRQWPTSCDNFYRVICTASDDSCGEGLGTRLTLAHT